jgi:hypothetical protein
MVKAFRVLAPEFEPIDLEKLDEYSAKDMKVTIKYPPSWERKENTVENLRRITLASPESRGGLKDPCPGVIVEKIPDAAIRFAGEAPTPEQIIMKYKNLYVKKMEETCEKVTVRPKSSLARLGKQAALAYKLEFVKANESRFALFVGGIQKGTVVQVFLTAPAETFHHYTPLFGKMLSTINAF